MLTKRAAIFLAVLSFSSILSADLRATVLRNTELFVFTPILNIHAGPGPDQNVIEKLAYGARVHSFLEDRNRSGVIAEWVKVRAISEASTTEGYVRADALLPIPTPDPAKSGFASLTDRLTITGDLTITRADDTTTAVQAYDHGVTLTTRTFHTPYGDFEEQHITASGFTVAQGFILARAIINQDGAGSDHLARRPNIEVDDEGNHFIFDDSHWQIISVVQTADGATISFPERAD